MENPTIQDCQILPEFQTSLSYLGLITMTPQQGLHRGATICQRLVIAVSGMDHDLPVDAAGSCSDGWFAHPRVPAHGNARIVAERHFESWKGYPHFDVLDGERLI